MSTSPEPTTQDAVAYHRSLAAGWEQRYAKPAFQARLRVFQECLAGGDVSGQQWLDAGCGSGTLARYLAGAGANVLAVDAAEEMIATARNLACEDKCSQRLRFEHLETIAHLPVADGSLDGIVCSSVLEYVDDPAACLTEFARVLRPAGLLVVSVANRNSIVRKGQIAAHRAGKLLGRKWCAFLDYSRNDFTAAAFRELLKQYEFSTGGIIPFGSPIPSWLQRREIGGSLLAFRAVRD